MTKEEKIKEAYGEYWVHLQKYINKNGEFAISNLDYDIVDIIDDLELVHLENGFSVLKSLAGIENNNGWVKIECEKDLPSENRSYWIETKDDMLVALFVPYKGDYGLFVDNNETYYSPDEVVAYYTIGTPPPRIY